jgi:DUF2075 family protein
LIVYQATKQQFLAHDQSDDIEQVILSHYRRATGGSVGASEIGAWKESLHEMGKVLSDPGIPADAGVAIEYQIPATSKRVDMLISGQDAQGRDSLIIVELKRWSSSTLTEKDGVIKAWRGGPKVETEGPHPSYQAWSYAALLKDFNEAVEARGIDLRPCAFLHNHPPHGAVTHPHYAAHLQRAPVFVQGEREKLQAFIRQHVRHGDARKVLYEIEHGRIRPSKMLSEAVVGLLKGQPEFVLIDDQKVVFETVMQIAARAHAGLRQVVIVQGGPGTGKSVLAINLLTALLAKQKNARYVSKNAAPRAVYEAKLTGTMTKSRFSNLFSGSGSFHAAAPDSFDVLIVDESHRLNEKSGLYGTDGENQVMEIIRSAPCAVFFVDDDQVVTLKDIGHSGELRRWAAQAGAQVTELGLSSQFRCNGSDGYLAWLDHVLQVRETANPRLSPSEYDFRVVDSPTELHELIRQRNAVTQRARVVAGYCWTWPSKNDDSAWDIVMPEFGYRRRWNLSKDGSLWIMVPSSVEEVGCIHTCQGLELDYVGVIIGPDLRLENGELVCDPKARAKSDMSIKGIGTLMKKDPVRAKQRADRIIKNTYRTLMSRGMKGCYVYCTDPALAQWLREHVEAVERLPFEAAPAVPSARVYPFPVLDEAGRRHEPRAVPVMDLRFAAGGFEEGVLPADGAQAWTVLPDFVTPAPDLFVAQVRGQSMNKRIPDGAWCLFRARPAGSRQGKVVVVQHREISDPETGGRYTIKRYFSEKVTDETGAWRHERIELRPESTFAGYETIVLGAEEEGEVQVVAEFLVTLAH